MSVAPPYRNPTLGAPTPRPDLSAIASAGRPGPTAAPRSGPRYREPLLLFVACAGRVWRKAYFYAAGAWDSEWRAFGDGPTGLYYLSHGQVATNGRLLSRASDGFVCAAEPTAPTCRCGTPSRRCSAPRCCGT